MTEQSHEHRRGWLRNGGVPCAIRTLPKCGAHARSSGKPCQKIAMKNGRCELHGGKAGAPPGPRNGNFKLGKYTKEATAARRDLAAHRRALRTLMALAQQGADIDEDDPTVQALLNGSPIPGQRP